MPPIQRGYRGALLDRLSSWFWGLPQESCSYTIESIRIPVGDAIELAADLYRPLNPKPLGTLLVRSPYGIGLPISLGHARIYAARGYVVLMSSCRGTATSGGEFRPGQDDAEDGQAVISWMREQAWYTGSFATLGGSYLGYTQWAILTNPPADMKTAVIVVGPHDLSGYLWSTGALNSDIIVWTAMMAAQKEGSSMPLPLFFWLQRDKIQRVMGSVPLLSGINEYLGNETPPMVQFSVTHPDLSDPGWAPMRQIEALDRVNIPINIITGWYDTMLVQAMEQYSRLVQRGCNIALTIGPWSHLETQGAPSKLESLSWLEKNLPDQNNGSNKPHSARIFVTGAQQWKQFPTWPPATHPRGFYLSSGKRLTEDQAPPEASDSSFTFNPTDPTPTIGSSTMIHMDGGKENDAALASRADVLTFTTEPLDRELEVLGKPTVELYHSTDHPYADLLVRLSDVDARGKSQNIAETYLRLDPKRSDEPLQLSLLDCAHKFRKGHRIRVVVAGGSHPRYVRNLGTGENPGTGSNLQAVIHTVRHNASASSRLTLPTLLSEN